MLSILLSIGRSLITLLTFLGRYVAPISAFFAGRMAANSSTNKTTAKVKDAQLKEAAKPRNRATTVKRMHDKSF